MATLPGIDGKKLEVIRSYYQARQTVGRPLKTQSALFRAAEDGAAGIYTIFGGQGNIEEYFDELREIYKTYQPFVGELILHAAELLQNLSKHPSAEKLYPKGLDILKWLEDEEATPDLDYLVSAPVSFPLIGLVQLAHYEVTCKALGDDSGLIPSRGSAVPRVTPRVLSWPPLPPPPALGNHGRRSPPPRAHHPLLDWRPQPAGVPSHLPATPTILRDSADTGEGTPTPMLCIRDLSKTQVQKHIDATNEHLPTDRHIAISLINSPETSSSLARRSRSTVSTSAAKGQGPHWPRPDQNPLHRAQESASSTVSCPSAAPFHSPVPVRGYRAHR